MKIKHFRCISDYLWITQGRSFRTVSKIFKKMETTDIIIQNLADALCKAEIKKQSIPPLTNTHPDLTPKWAYQIQLEVIKRKIREGRSVVG